MGTGPTIFLSAAEASGDHHAAGLVRALKDRLPGARFVGAAGPAMQEAGCESIIDLTASATMLGGVLGKIMYYRRAVRKIRESIREIRPDILVPVDSPALNWHVAKAAKAGSIPVMYYVAPQVWAWAPWRIKKVRRLTDHVACLLPFEEEYFRSRDVAATFVGHPLFDRLPESRESRECPDLAGAWHEGSWRVAMLPGSRAGEIAGIAPAMAVTAAEICKRWAKAECTFLAADELAADRIRAATRREDLHIVTGDPDRVLSDSHFAVAASGTVTLQVASYGIPMAIVYNISAWQKLFWKLFVRRLIRTKHLSLVNILAGREIVPELMPYFRNTGEVVSTAIECMEDYGWLYSTRDKLLELTEPLRSRGLETAAGRTADLIVDMLGGA